GGAARWSRFCRDGSRPLPVCKRLLSSPSGRSRDGRPTGAPAHGQEVGAAFDPASLPARAVRRRLLEFLQAGPSSLSDIRAQFPRAAAAIRELTANGWAAVTETGLAKLHPGAAGAGTDTAPDLTAEQAAAVERICASWQSFQTHLLLGVAGSGKTEVYLHAIAAILAR